MIDRAISRFALVAVIGLGVSGVTAGSAAARSAARPATGHGSALAPAGSVKPSRRHGPPNTPPPAAPVTCPPAGSVWQCLTHPAPFNTQTMLLLTDGSVMVQQTQTENWWRLTPDSSGSYLNGAWTQLASMPAGYSPTYYASAILPDGRVLVEGGEYIGTGSTAVESNRGAIYDPVANSWTPVNPPSGWPQIGDAVATVLANGKFMMGELSTTRTVLFNPSTLGWQAVGTGKADINSEEGWSLLPNGQVLTVDAWNGRNSEVFTPSTAAWTSAGTLPSTLVSSGPDCNGDFPSVELGPQVLRPNGTVFATGASKFNAVYDTATGTWSAGPSWPKIGPDQLCRRTDRLWYFPTGMCSLPRVRSSVSRNTFTTSTARRCSRSPTLRPPRRSRHIRRVC